MLWVFSSWIEQLQDSLWRMSMLGYHGTVSSFHAPLVIQKDSALQRTLGVKQLPFSQDVLTLIQYYSPEF